MKKNDEIFKSLDNILSVNACYPDNFIVITIKREILDENGAAIPAAVHLIDNENTVYLLGIPEHTNKGFSSNLKPYTTNNGQKLKFNDLIKLILNDKNLSDLIDSEKIKSILDSNIPLKELSNILPRCKQVKTESLYIPNNKLARNINEVIKAGDDGVIVDITNKSTNQKIYTNCIISFDNEKTHLSNKIDQYDTLVYNAIASIAEYNGTENLITLENIYRVMIGDETSATPSEKHLERIKQSIDKMRVYLIKIDCTDEVNAYKKAHLINESDSLKTDFNGKFFFDTYLLACEWVVATSSRYQVNALHLIKKPVMLDYAKISGQILNIPSYLLNTKHIQANTERNLILKDYLLRRIEGMKGENNLTQNNISLISYTRAGKHHKGLYEIVTGKAEVSRRDAGLIRESTAKYLDFWKGLGYIKGYTIEKKGRSFHNIKIEICQ